MANQIVPLSSQQNQSLSVQLTVDGQSLTLNLKIGWSSMAGYWVMTIFDAQGNLLLDSLPMITGTFPAANILSQYGYLKIGSAYLLNVGNSDDYPGINELGSDFLLLWGDTA
jgi:hypothetical protein